jgi:hypothetical protein
MNPVESTDELSGYIVRDESGELSLRPGKYDAGQRRRALRSGRERGCWIYVPAAELLRAGVDPTDPPPLYRIWATPRGGLFGRFYKRDS